MKTKNFITLGISLAASIVVLNGCAARSLECSLNVVFMNEGEIVDCGKVDQFTNFKSPTLPDSYIPNNYRFLGWTCYSESELDYSDPAHFKTQYIAAGRMIHYMDVCKFADNQTVVMNSLIIHKDDVPKEYHYAVVAWYDKAANSGLNQDIMDAYEAQTRSYLLESGISEEDVNSVVFRGYAGNVGPTTGQILYDDDVDIMLGWGSVSNITTTGSIPEEMIKQSESYQITYNGEVKNRYIHRLTDNPGALKMMEYLLSEASVSYFNK